MDSSSITRSANSATRGRSRRHGHPAAPTRRTRLRWLRSPSRRPSFENLDIRARRNFERHDDHRSSRVQRAQVFHKAMDIQPGIEITATFPCPRTAPSVPGVAGRLPAAANLRKPGPYTRENPVTQVLETEDVGRWRNDPTYRISGTVVASSPGKAGGVDTVRNADVRPGSRRPSRMFRRSADGARFSWRRRSVSDAVNAWSAARRGRLVHLAERLFDAIPSPLRAAPLNRANAIPPYAPNDPSFTLSRRNSVAPHVRSCKSRRPSKVSLPA